MKTFQVSSSIIKQSAERIHPDLVAERLARYAELVGRERVLVGTDCGFGTFAGFGAVHPDIAYAKLASLTEGAWVATGRLW